VHEYAYENIQYGHAQYHGNEMFRVDFRLELVSVETHMSVDAVTSFHSRAARPACFHRGSGLGVIRQGCRQPGV